MSIAELERAIASKKRVAQMDAEANAKERAAFDYILADLIGRSIARIHNSANKYPEIGAVYPNLFDTEEIAEKKAEKMAELSAIRFRQFAQLHNQNYKEVEN